MWWWVYEVCKAGKSQSALLCTPHIIQKTTQKMSDHKGEGEPYGCFLQKNNLSDSPQCVDNHLH